MSRERETTEMHPDFGARVDSTPIIRWSQTSAADRLAVYVSDHAAAAHAGVALARRMARRHARQPWGDAIVGVAADIEDDLGHLDAVMAVLELEPSRFKQAVALVLERGARWKLNGQVLGQSELSFLVELEGLTSGVASKRGLWRSLAAVLPDDPLPHLSLAELIDRADDQLDRLEELRPMVAKVALR